MVLGAVILLAGCARSGGSPQGPPPSTPPPPAALRMDETATGTTVRVRVGQPVLVDLHSSYWQHLASADPAILREAAATTPLPAPTCRVLGSGCGTFETAYAAVAPGTTTVTADRTSCGEAMACAPEQRTFTVTVVVERG